MTSATTMAFATGIALLLLSRLRRLRRAGSLSYDHLPTDVAVAVFAQLPFRSRLICACVSTEWRRASLDPVLYRSIDRTVLGRRDLPRALIAKLVHHFAHAETVEVGLAGCAAVDEELVGALLAHAPNVTSLDLSACDVGDAALLHVGGVGGTLKRLRLFANQKVSDAGVLALAARRLNPAILHVQPPFPLARPSCTPLTLALEDLDLRACSGVTSEVGLVALVTGCPNVRAAPDRHARPPRPTATQGRHARLNTQPSRAPCVASRMVSLSRSQRARRAPRPPLTAPVCTCAACTCACAYSCACCASRAWAGHALSLTPSSSRSARTALACTPSTRATAP
jgi:hypothetical protein